MSNKRVGINTLQSQEKDFEWLEKIRKKEEHEICLQQRLFYSLGICSVLLLVVFVCILCSSDFLMLLHKSPFVIFPVSLLALIPFVWISLLIRAVFLMQNNKQENSIIDAVPSMPSIKEVAEIAKNITS